MLCTAPASTVVPQELQPVVATGAASQPHAGAGASQPHAGAGAPQDDRRARSLARRPTRPPQVGAGSQQAGAASQQVGAGAGSQQTGAGAGSQQAGAGAGSQQVGAGAQQAALRAFSFAKRPTRPPQVGAGSQQVGAGSQTGAGSQAGAGSQHDAFEAFSFAKRPTRPPQDAEAKELDMTTAANAKEAIRILTILNSSQGILKLCPRKRHDAHPEISMDHSRQKPLRRSLRIKLPGLTKLAKSSG